MGKEEAQKKEKEIAEKKKAEATAKRANTAAKKVNTATKKASKPPKTRKADANKENFPAVRCVECGRKEEDDDGKVWIGCDTCENWAHLLCTTLDPDLASEDLEDMEYYAFFLSTGAPTRPN